MKLIELPALPIAFLRRTGPYGPENRALVERLKRLARDADLLDAGSVIFCAAWDDPACTPPEACRYDACLVLRLAARLPDTRSGYLPDGRYVCFTVPHTPEALSEIYGTAVRTVGCCRLSADPSRPMLEAYPLSLVQRGRCQFYVPVL